MTERAEEQELKDRLKLIEAMIHQGRCATESWGWTFILWGVAYYVAIAWATWGNHDIAWPITMTLAAVLTGIIASRMKHDKPDTTLGRAIGSVWIAFGISVFLLLMSLGLSGKMESQTSIAIFCAMLGMANATSGLILRWKMQLACAVVWWITTLVACFGTPGVASIAVLIAIFLCQIAFGVYATIRESQRQRPHGRSQGATHA